MKLRYLIIPAALSAALSSQVLSLAPTSPSTSVGIEAPTIRPGAASPLLGYTNDAGTLDLRTILGKAGSPVLGDRVPLPENTRRLYLAPRGLYALLSKASLDNPLPSLSVWTLHQGQPEVTVAGAVKSPDAVGFSPRGSAAALYSQTDGQVEIVTGLPLQPVVHLAPSLTLFGTPSQFAVSDDGSLTLAAFPDGRLMLSKEHGAWTILPANFFPAAWTFIPASHELAIADTTQQVIVLLPNAADPAGFRILAQGIEANQLAVSKDGSYLAAAGSGGNTLWTIDLKDGALTARQIAPVQTLATLRDGFSFLLSSAPAVSVITLAPRSTSPTLIQ